ncbi:MAG TPA: sigma-70 family RNA polymerase sigma factor [Planctomycetota bacterium]|nr:sigma-70 family RNA polymerase sigma factor [Planctomycetota bacterium]
MPDDADLYERAATGDGASLDALLARYLPQLHAYVHVRLSNDLRSRESSMDVVQSVCRDLLAERGRFDFRGEERFRAWLFTAALNKIRDKHRFHHRAGRDVRREQEGEHDFDLTIAKNLLTPSQGAIDEEAARQVHEALGELSEDHREVITLARIVGLPHRVIAEMMQRTEEGTRKLLGRALVQFTTALKRRGIEDV